MDCGEKVVSVIYTDDGMYIGNGLIHYAKFSILPHKTDFNTFHMIDVCISLTAKDSKWKPLLPKFYLNELNYFHHIILQLFF